MRQHLLGFTLAPLFLLTTACSQQESVAKVDNNETLSATQNKYEQTATLKIAKLKKNDATSTK